jgi:mevalonate kinase
MAKAYQSSAPGSIMLMGEHAVLRDKLALVGAVDKRMTATLTPQENQHVDIFSELGEYHGTLHQLEDSTVFRFVLAVIKLYHAKITSGFRLDIHSGFSSTVGLGSSAAVVVATLACLQQWCDHINHQQLFLDARSIIQKVQGRGSGADVVASVYGGIVAYRMEPLLIKKSEHIFDIALIYTGYKTPTPEVIKVVDQRVQSDPKKYARLFNEMNDCSEKAWQAIQQKNWTKLGKFMQQHQHAQTQLGVCDQKTAELLHLLQQNPNVLGCKISGSGLGDCVVSLTTSSFDWHHQNFMRIDATLSATGVTYESQ